MKVGIGRVVITPRERLWLGGYAHRDHPSDGVIHDIYAKAAAFSAAGENPVVLVATDLLGFPHDVANRIASKVETLHGIPRDRLMLTSTHTHSGPVIRGGLTSIYNLAPEQTDRIGRYTENLVDLVVDSVEKALNDLEPVELYWGSSRAEFAVNRREYTLDGIIIGRNPIGPTDKAVPVLSARRPDGTVKAVVFGYACHNTVLDLHQFSGDYAGFAQLEVERKLPGATALFVAGCAGDQNPHPRRALELAQKHGEDLAHAALSVLSGEMSKVTGPIRTAFEEIPLDLETPDHRACLDAKSPGLDDPLREKARGLLAGLKARPEQPETYSYPVQVWRFGDSLRLTALGGEAVVDYSLRIKLEAAEANHWVLAYANDVMGYIPSLRVLREGGYEGDLSMIFYGFAGVWGPTIERDILVSVRRLGEETR